MASVYCEPEKKCCYKLTAKALTLRSSNTVQMAAMSATFPIEKKNIPNVCVDLCDRNNL